MNELEILQNKAIKAILNLNYRHPTSHLYTTENNIIPLKQISKYQVAILIYKIKNNFIKHNFNIQYCHNIHNHTTRQTDHIYVPRSNLNIGKNSVLNRGTQQFNKLPNKLKNTNSIGEFKHELKKYITNNQD